MSLHPCIPQVLGVMEDQRQHQPPRPTLAPCSPFCYRGAAKNPRNDPRRGRQGVRAAHLGHDASFVHEEPAEAGGFLGNGVGVEPCQAVPQCQVLGLGVFGCCLGWEDTKLGAKKRSEEEVSWLSRQRR